MALRGAAPAQSIRALAAVFFVFFRHGALAEELVALDFWLQQGASEDDQV